MHMPVCAFQQVIEMRIAHAPPDPNGGKLVAVAVVVVTLDHVVTGHVAEPAFLAKRPRRVADITQLALDPERRRKTVRAVHAHRPVGDT